MKAPANEREAKMREAMQAIIRPIVIGQLKVFCAHHPNALAGHWVSSIEKRITNDLLSRDVTLRLGLALAAATVATPAMEGDGCKAVPCGRRRASRDAPSPNAGLAEQADAADLNSAAIVREGSSPSAGTIMHVAV